jgi:hypothetical protein
VLQIYASGAAYNTKRTRQIDALPYSAPGITYALAGVHVREAIPLFQKQELVITTSRLLFKSASVSE